MKKSIQGTGIPSRDMIEATLPSAERRKAGPYAVIECWQQIPCNPCVASCPFHCIADMANINDLPVLDHSICTGCGVCVSQCPGLAIFTIDETYGSENEASIRIPHEFAPLPKAGDEVRALARDGSFIGKARVIKVRNTKSKTPVVEIVIKHEYILEVRAIEPLGNE